jgi:hypothetical protein
MTIPAARNINLYYKTVCSSSLRKRKDTEDARNVTFWWKKMAGVTIYCVGVLSLCPGRISRLYERKGEQKVKKEMYEIKCTYVILKRLRGTKEKMSGFGY